MVDVNTPVTNPDLVAAMEALQGQGNPQTWGAFRTALLAAHFLSPVTFSPGLDVVDGTATPPVGTTLAFAGVTDGQGASWLPVFTDWPALRAWRDQPDEHTLITTFDDVRTVALRDGTGAGFVINPGTHGFPVGRDLAAQLTAVPHIQVPIAGGTTVELGLPARDPVVLKQAVAAHLATQPGVAGAWLVLMNSSGTFSYLVAVDFTGDQRTLFDGLAAAAHPALGPGELLDLVPATSEIGRYVAQHYPPFYTAPHGPLTLQHNAD